MGKTTDSNKRKYDHQGRCNNENNRAFYLKLYSFIRAHGGFDNFVMEIVEKIKCDNNTESLMKEKEWYDRIDSQLNSNVPIYDNKEEKNQSRRIYHAKKMGDQIQENKVKRQERKIISKNSDEYKKMIIERHRIYSNKYANKVENKEKISENQKIRHQNNKKNGKCIIRSDEYKEKMKEVSKNNHEKHKIRYENDVEYREKIQEAKRIYYQNNTKIRNEKKKWIN